MASIIEYIRFLFIAFTLGLGGCNGLGGGDATQLISAQIAEAAAPVNSVEANKTDYRLPAKVTLCDEAFDMNRRAVYERLEFEFLRVVNHPAQVALWQRRAATYFPYIESQLKAAGLPDDLKYLAMAESDLRPWVASPAGALGVWQFMPATAKHFGLTVNKKIDERQLPEPLAGAAVSYFKSLKTRFGTWSLAMAAYNAGDGRIAKAVSAQGTNSYFDLDLPRETERYVYRIAAIKVVLENAAQYGFTQTVPQNHYNPVNFVEKEIQVAAGSDWNKLAKQAGCDYKTLRMLNPHIRQIPSEGSCLLRLPGNS